MASRAGRPRAPARKVRPRRRHPILLLVAAMLLLWPAASVLLYRFVDPPVTILMLVRMAQGQGRDQRWRPLSAISPRLPQAVIAGEDARFCRHHGFDFVAMQAAARRNADHPGRVRGGSTITQQTAKNVFLWPARDYLRKTLEAGYAALIEAIWGKRRIMEVYLNVVEWGPGIYGAEAAAQRYFHEPAAALGSAQSARLAAILPNPLKWRALAPGRYVARRSRSIGANAVEVRAEDLADCLVH